MLNFTVGPVQSSDAVRQIGAEQVPYFRTQEFSNVMLENEQLMLKLAKAPQGARAVFITGSGTASMEAVIMNTLTTQDKALVVNGGSFGHRFVELCEIHNVPHDVIVVEMGHDLTEEILMPYAHKGYTAFVVNVHETSTGVHYNIELISRFCKENGLLLIVDAISSFLADDFNMAELGADVMITGSQKALACPPGISIIVLSPNAICRVEKNERKCMYLDLKAALKNMERGQTPFTPAVSILLQINARLKEIDQTGGVEGEIGRISDLAEYFREQIKNLPFDIASQSMSNAVTPLHPQTALASEVCQILKDEYGIWICPNGGELKDSIFRVGHIGHLTKNDYDTLFDALNDMHRRKLI